MVATPGNLASSKKSFSLKSWAIDAASLPSEMSPSSTSRVFGYETMRLPLLALALLLRCGRVRLLRCGAAGDEHRRARVHLRNDAGEPLGLGEAGEVAGVLVHPVAESLPEGDG